jgi:hypothetical protein
MFFIVRKNMPPCDSAIPGGPAKVAGMFLHLRAM